MPGLPMVVRETTNLGCNCSHSRSVDQMCRQDPHVRLSSEDAIAAEESLSMYCKPVELYNILQRRALRNPSFLQRCLHYKIQAKHKRRLRAGNVIFNYRYFNNTLQKTEVTVDFSCPFCLVPCASFKGLKYHLISSHDLFNFEFWLTEEYHAVNVSVKTDIWRSEIAVDGVDLKLQTFFFCSKSCRHRSLKNLVKNAKNVHPHVMKVESTEGEDPCTSSFNIPTEASSKDAEPLNVLSLPRSENDSHFDKDNGGKFSRSVFNESLLQLEGHKPDWCPESPCAVEGTEPVASNSNMSGVCLATAQASASNESAELASGNNLATLPMLQFAKTKKLSVERAGNRALLQKRQFFHSHRAQPMALDQVLSDKDSEDEVDDAIADFEDRRMLDDFVDVTKVEKQLMHLWNSFVRKQRVLADGHIPWACEAFSRLHGRDLVQTPALIWCWRLFMIKLWNHSLLDARTMNSCNIILESYGNEKTDPMLS